MTTTTDWDVRDPETGPLRVTDVEAALRLDGAATDTALHTLLHDNYTLRAELERTKAELAQLKSIVSPLEAPWTPPTEQPTAWIEQHVIAHRAAEHRPSADTHTYVADMHRENRSRWDSVHDDLDALTAHDPATVWDDGLRALLAERVEVDYSYRRTEAALWAQAMAEFAKLDEDEQQRDSQEDEQEDPQPALPVSPEGQAFLDQGPAADEAMPGRADRSDVERMRERVQRKDVLGAHEAAEPEPRSPWWRWLLERWG